MAGSATILWVMIDGSQLLTRFREARCEQAFSELMRRYVGLVFSVARRRLGDAHLAEDVAQTVFLRLAQSPPQPRHEAALLGWLHRTTLHVSIDLWRARSRRETREHAAAMDLPRPDASTPAAPAHEELLPVLDQAISDLRETDREALLLRFFQEKPMREIGDALRISEGAAKMRVGRALENLREQLARHGVTASAAVLAVWLDDHAVQAAPPGLAAKLAEGVTIPSPAAAVSLGAGGSWSSWLSPSPLGVALVLLGVAGAALLFRPAGSPPELPSPPPAVVVTENAGATPPNPPQAVLLPPVEGSAPLVMAAAATDLEGAEAELRRVLTDPRPSRMYPPPSLLRALQRFGKELRRALPILLEKADAPDYETRAWAASGISLEFQLLANPPYERADLDAAFEQAGPWLKRLVGDHDAPGLIRQQALQALLAPSVAPVVDPASGTPAEVPPLHPVAKSILLAQLADAHAPADDFQFTLLDLLSPRLSGASAEAGALRDVLRGELAGDSARQRLLAAYALASMAGEQRPEIQAELLKALTTKSADTYRVTRALGQLGPEGRTAVPALLAFATDTETYADGSFSRSARTAACRLDPTLRSQFPEIDAQLKQEEEAAAVPAVVDAQSTAPTVGQVVLQMYRRLGKQRLSFPDTGADPEAMRQTWIAGLEAEMNRAPVEERAEILQAMEWIRSVRTLGEQEPEQPAPAALPFDTLILAARVLATDLASEPGRGFDEVRFSAFLEKFPLARPSPGGERVPVTAANFANFSQALRDYDARFEQDWRKALRRDYPALDRAVPELRR